MVRDALGDVGTPGRGRTGRTVTGGGPGGLDSGQKQFYTYASIVAIDRLVPSVECSHKTGKAAASQMGR